MIVFLASKLLQCILLMQYSFCFMCRFVFYTMPFIADMTMHFIVLKHIPGEQNLTSPPPSWIESSLSYVKSFLLYHSGKMPKLHLIVHSTAVTKSCSTINSWVENCHSLPDSDDSSCCDHDTPSKTACKSNIRDSEDNSVHHEYTIRKYAEDEDREGDALFHKSNNPELSNMK